MLRQLLLTVAVIAAPAAAWGPDVIWSRRLDFGADEMAWGIDSRGGDIVACGYRTDESLTAGCLVVKLDQSGDTVWTSAFGTGLDDYATAVCLDADGNVYVVGYVSQIFGRGRPEARRLLPAAWDDLSALVRKYDPQGGLKWSHTLSGRAALGVACDDSGNCYVSGTAGDLRGSSDFWCAGYSAGGDSLWSVTLDFGPLDLGYRACKTPGPGISFCGFSLAGDNSFGVIVRVGPDGETLWTRAVHLGRSAGLMGIAADRFGNLVAAGAVSDSAADMQLLAVKCDSAGNLLWQRTLVLEGVPQALGAACDSAGNAFVVGTTTAWPCRAFAVKYSPGGDTLWTVTGTGVEDEYYEVACDPAGNPVCAGRVSDGSWSDLLVVKYRGLAAVQEPAPTPPAPVALAGIVRGAAFLDVGVPGRYRLEFFDRCGRSLGRFHDGWLGQGRHRLPLPAAAAGAYLVRLTAPGGRTARFRAVVLR